MNRALVLRNTVAAIVSVTILAFQWGCAGPATSKTVKGGGTGALVGAGAGALAGGDTGTIAAAGAAGAIVGATIGAIQQSKEAKRQNELAQQRAYSQAIAVQKRSQEKEKAQIQEELDIAEGFRITDTELDEMTARAESAEADLKALQAKKAAALERKKTLDEMEQRERDALEEAERLRRELEELEGTASSDLSLSSEI